MKFHSLLITREKEKKSFSMLRTNIKYNYIQINSNNFLQIIKIINNSTRKFSNEKNFSQIVYNLIIIYNNRVFFLERFSLSVQSKLNRN